MAGATSARTVAHPHYAPELPLSPDLLVEHGGTVTVGDCPLEVIHLRGHTPGSIALLHRDTDGTPHLFSGDSLFPGGVGRAGSPEDFRQLMDDVEQRVFDQLPDETWFTPDTGTTPRSAPSDRTSPNGASADGDLTDQHDRGRLPK